MIEIPTINQWYVNQTGQLIKVKLLLFSNATVKKVMFEYLDGTMKVITYADWNTSEFKQKVGESV